MLLHLWVHCRVPQSIFNQNIKGHSLLLAMTRHRVSGQVWACLGLSWFYLVWTMGWWPNLLPHLLEVKLCECLLWSSLTNCGSHGAANHSFFLSVEAGSWTASRLKLGASWYPMQDLQTQEEGGTSLHEYWPTSPAEPWGCWQLAESCCPILPGESHLHCLRSQRAAGRGSVTWEKKGSWTKDNCLLYFD